MASVTPDGAAIRKTRRQKKLSQEAVAALSRELPRSYSPISDRTLRSAERGTRISEDSMATIAAVLEVPVARLTLEERDPDPFPGLRPFGFDDHAAFGGRESLTVRGAGLLSAHRSLLVIGPSGSGKSSLCLSGIAPILLAEAPNALFVAFRPGTGARRSLAHALSESLAAEASLEDAVETARRFNASFEADDAALSDLLRAAAGRGVLSEVLIYVDQGEELCTTATDTDAFIRLMRMALTEAHAPTVRVMISIRPEYVGRFTHLNAEFADYFGGVELVLRRMTHDELRDAIERPMRMADIPHEPALVDMIVRDAAREPGYLPHIQFLLQSLWRSDVDPSERLTLGRYGDVGGISGVISRHASRIYGQLSADERALARAVLPRLVAIEQGTRDVSRACPLNSFTPAAQRLMERLAAEDARIVSISEDDGGITIVEFTHEEVIRQWPELIGWLEEDSDRARMIDRMQRDIVQWIEADESADYLIPPGRKLAEYQRLSSTLPDDALPPRAREFVSTSREAFRFVNRNTKRLAAMAVSVALAVALGVGGIGALRSYLEDRWQGEAMATVRALSATKSEGAIRARSFFFPDASSERFAVDAEIYRAFRGLYDTITEAAAVRDLFDSCHSMEGETLEALYSGRLALDHFAEKCGYRGLIRVSMRHMVLTSAIVPESFSLVGARFTGSYANRIDFRDADLNAATFACSVIDGSDFGDTRNLRPSQLADSFCLFPDAGPPTVPAGHPLPKGCRWLPALKKRFGWRDYGDAARPQTATESDAIARARAQTVERHWYDCLEQEDLFDMADAAYAAAQSGNLVQAVRLAKSALDTGDHVYATAKTAPVLMLAGETDDAMAQYEAIAGVFTPRWGKLSEMALGDALELFGNNPNYQETIAEVRRVLTGGTVRID